MGQNDNRQRDDSIPLPRGTAKEETCDLDKSWIEQVLKQKETQQQHALELPPDFDELDLGPRIKSNPPLDE